MQTHRGKFKRLVTLSLFILAAVLGTLGGDWGSASAQTIPGTPISNTPTETSVPQHPGPSDTSTPTVWILPSPTKTPSATATEAAPAAEITPEPTVGPLEQTPPSETAVPQVEADLSEAAVEQEPSAGNGSSPQVGWFLGLGLALMLLFVWMVRRRRTKQE